jgi:hypothetical protein
MNSRKAAALLSIILALAAGSAWGNDFGTRAEAEKMLKRAVAVLKADERRALDLFTSGDGGFIHKDLYVFCAGNDGMLTAHPHFMGINLKGWKDKTGKAVGEEIYAIAREGEFAQVSYSAPRPKGGKSSAVTASEADQVEKVSFVTKVGSQICGVGFYK